MRKRTLWILVTLATATLLSVGFLASLLIKEAVAPFELSSYRERVSGLALPKNVTRDLKRSGNEPAWAENYRTITIDGNILNLFRFSQTEIPRLRFLYTLVLRGYFLTTVPENERLKLVLIHTDLGGYPCADSVKTERVKWIESGTISSNEVVRIYECCELVFEKPLGLHS
jgi:hypothetical protein